MAIEMTWLKSLALATLAVFAPVKAVVGAVFLLCLLDMITGVLAARKRGETIRSARMRDTVLKMLAFELVILAAFTAEKWLLDGALPVVKLAAGAIGVTELLSAVENVNTVLGRNLFGALLGRLQSPNAEKPPIEKS